MEVDVPIGVGPVAVVLVPSGGGIKVRGLDPPWPFPLIIEVKAGNSWALIPVVAKTRSVSIRKGVGIESMEREEKGREGILQRERGRGKGEMKWSMAKGWERKHQAMCLKRIGDKRRGCRERRIGDITRVSIVPEGILLLLYQQLCRPNFYEKRGAKHFDMTSSGNGYVQ